MQGSQSSSTALPEIVIFDNDSASTESGIDSPLPWIPSQNQLPSSGTQSQYPEHVRSGMGVSEWYIGGPSFNVPRATNESFLTPNSSISNTAIAPQNLSMSLQFKDHEENNNNGGNPIDGSEDRPGSSSLDGRRVSCKRKAIELETGSSSGSSICFQNSERRHCHTIPEDNICNMNIPVPPENNTITNNAPEQSFTPNIFSLAIPNVLRQQDQILPENPFLPGSTSGENVDFSSSRHSSRVALRNQLLDLNPTPVLENGSFHQQSALLEAPTVRQIHQPRWSGSPSARITRSSALIHEESTDRTIPRHLLEHPMFVPSGDTRNLSQSHTNWNFSDNNNNNTIDNSPTVGNGNAPFTFRVGSTRGESSVGSHRNLPQYQRRLSEIARRSMMSGRTVVNNQVVRSQESMLPVGADSNNNNNVARNLPILRSGLLERHLDGGGASRVPNLWRSWAAANSEGRNSSVMSEQIRRFLSLMRRREGLRFEDAMILDQSILSGMANIHDRHRDMRLDVDSMSYEELLALEERIGDVCTGLSEETVSNNLKQRKFVNYTVVDQVETEPCSICREEYNDGEDLGTLECGHDFHAGCIKQWLVQKNLCPICKTTGLKSA